MSDDLGMAIVWQQGKHDDADTRHLEYSRSLRRTALGLFTIPGTTVSTVVTGELFFDFRRTDSSIDGSSNQLSTGYALLRTMSIRKRWHATIETHLSPSLFGVAPHVSRSQASGPLPREGKDAQNERLMPSL